MYGCRRCDTDRDNEVRIDGYGTCECDTDGVGRVTGVRINGDTVDGHRSSGGAIAGHDGRGGACTIFRRGHVTSLIQMEVAHVGAGCRLRTRRG